MTEMMLAPVPYKGLVPYSEGDAPFFFGRETETKSIIAHLWASRLTLLYGISGVGKSSVLRAGVADNLRQLAHQNLTNYHLPKLGVVLFNSWLDDPIVALIERVEYAVRLALNDPAINLDTQSRSLTQTMQAGAERVGGRLFVILDQFEDYFLYHPVEKKEGTFGYEFPRMVKRADLPVNFLISIREDMLAKLDRFRGQIPNLFESYLRIEFLNGKAARAAILKPVEQYNRLHASTAPAASVEASLVEAVLRQVQSGQVILMDSRSTSNEDWEETAQIETPYLQLVMTRLWEEEMQAGSPVLRLETLEHLGGAERIVRGHLDVVMRSMTIDEQGLAAQVFQFLVTPSGSLIAYSASDLASIIDVPQTQLVNVLEKLSSGSARILRPIQPPPDKPHVLRYEIFHEVLAPAVLDWRSRFLQSQAQTQAQAESSWKRTLSRFFR